VPVLPARPRSAPDTSKGGIVNWTAVIADANAGIKSDFNIFMDPTNGWDVAWVIQHYANRLSQLAQMSQFWLGMADTSGGYNLWLSLPVANRVPFTVVTPDRRFPQGTTRTVQSGVTVPGTFTATPYFRNRPASAISRETRWGFRSTTSSGHGRFAWPAASGTTRS